MTAIILKTFKLAPELSFHFYYTEKFKNPFQILASIKVAW